jgi:hypothetical protein
MARQILDYSSERIKILAYSGIRMLATYLIPIMPDHKYDSCSYTEGLPSRGSL